MAKAPEFGTVARAVTTLYLLTDVATRRQRRATIHALSADGRSPGDAGGCRSRRTHSPWPAARCASQGCWLQPRDLRTAGHVLTQHLGQRRGRPAERASRLLAARSEEHTSE